MKTDANGWLERLLAAATAAIVLFMAYTWLARAGNDLTWDEAYNLRTYARSPLSAAALYREPNNHPLESLLKSVLVDTLGLDSPVYVRLAGFVVLLTFLLILRGWRRALMARGAIFAATVAMLAPSLARAVHEQAMALRGYFLSITLQLGYGLLLVARGDLVARAMNDVGLAPQMTGRTRWAFAGISALLLYTLPSNLALLVPLWITTAMLLRGADATPRAPWRSVCVEVTRLALRSGVIAAVLWTPLLASVILGSKRLRGVPAYEIQDRMSSIADQARLLVQQLGPVGAPDPVFFGVVGGLVGAALLIRFRSIVTRSFVTLGALTMLIVCGVTAFMSFPPRIASPFVGPMILCLIAASLVLSVRWPRPLQLVAALALTGTCFLTLPAVAESETFRRHASDLCAFLVTATRAGEHRVLVCHEGAETLRPVLHRAFGHSNVCDSLKSFERRTRPQAATSRPVADDWKEEIRARLAPPEIEPPLDLGAIECLVLVGEKEIPGGATEWKDPALEPLKSRLSKRTVFRADLRAIEIYEAP